ncbi:MAG: superoxide dismutase family protein, partial [Sphingomonas sp.]|nr:superoxide dismutase family protein [Sphingomonas sp.]
MTNWGAGMRTLLFLVPLILAACDTVEPVGGPPMPLVNSAGQSIGTVRAWQTAGGLSFHINASGLPHGLHGIHVHAVGRCDPPDFASAGPHWNPLGKKHGLNNPAGPH